MFEGWGEFLALPVEDRLRVLTDPGERKRLQVLAEGTPDMRHLSAWGKLRIVETVLALVGFVLSLPVMLLTALAIKLESRGPVVATRAPMRRDRAWIGAIGVGKNGEGDGVGRRRGHDTFNAVLGDSGQVTGKDEDV